VPHKYVKTTLLKLLVL